MNQLCPLGSSVKEAHRGACFGADAVVAALTMSGFSWPQTLRKIGGRGGGRPLLRSQVPDTMYLDSNNPCICYL